MPFWKYGLLSPAIQCRMLLQIKLMRIADKALIDTPALDWQWWVVLLCYVVLWLYDNQFSVNKYRSTSLCLMSSVWNFDWVVGKLRMGLALVEALEGVMVEEWWEAGVLVILLFYLILWNCSVLLNFMKIYPSNASEIRFLLIEGQGGLVWKAPPLGYICHKCTQSAWFV